MAEKPVIVVLRGVLQDSSGRFLLLQRSSKSKSWPSFWEFPGGKVDQGESDDLALSREFIEETGLVVRVGRLLSDFLWERKTDTIHYRIFFVDQISGDVMLSAEHDAMGWFSLGEIRSLNVSPPLVKVLEIL